MTILIDADAFIGLRNKQDPHHQRATKLLRLIEPKQPVYYTSWDVVDEVVTKLAYHASTQHSLDFLQFIETGGVKLVYPTSKRFKAVYKLFAAQTRKKTSLTDCMNMVIAQEINADAIFSYDKIYPKNGFQLLKDALPQK